MGWRWKRQRVTVFTATYMEPGLLSSLPDKNTKILSAMPETHFSVPLGAEIGSFRGPVGLESSKPMCHWVIHLRECFLLTIWLKTNEWNLDTQISKLALSQWMGLVCWLSSDTDNKRVTIPHPQIVITIFSYKNKHQGDILYSNVLSFQADFKVIIQHWQMFKTLLLVTVTLWKIHNY